MAPTLKLIDRDGHLVPFTVRTERTWHPTPSPKMNRIAYSAAHVVADARSAADPWLTAAVDWDATLAYRERLFSLGLGVAEAMDTAQRGMGLDWPTSLELIPRRADCLWCRHRSPRASRGPHARRRDSRV